MKRMHIAHTVAAALTVALMALPFGVSCYYASPTETGAIDFSTVQTVSFFDIRLFEFQNPLPFFTALLAVALLGLSIWRLVASSTVIGRVTTVLSAVTLVLTLLPLVLYGAEYFSTIAMTAAFLLLCMVIIDIYVWQGKLLYTPKDAEPTA